jgi:predicted O-methyltransferase YrrM
MAARDQAAAAGFARSCDDAVGRLLAVLAAAVPAAGSILELGTGTGVGLAWIVSGLEGRDDVRVTSVEADPATAARAATLHWPTFVELRLGDALGVLEAPAAYDLIFADAPAGKMRGLGQTLGRLRLGGVLVVDDMHPKPHDPSHQERWPLLVRARDTLLSDPRLVSAELDVASGVVIATRRRA